VLAVHVNCGKCAQISMLIQAFSDLRVTMISTGRYHTLVFIGIGVIILANSWQSFPDSLKCTPTLVVTLPCMRNLLIKGFFCSVNQVGFILLPRFKTRKNMNEQETTGTWPGPFEYDSGVVEFSNGFGESTACCGW